MLYQLDCTLYAGVSSSVEFPEGKTWDDVATWGVKWDTLYVTLKDGTEFEKALHSDSTDAIDWKWPTSVGVYAIDEETGETD